MSLSLIVTGRNSKYDFYHKHTNKISIFGIKHVGIYKIMFKKRKKYSIIENTNRNRQSAPQSFTNPFFNAIVYTLITAKMNPAFNYFLHEEMEGMYGLKKQR